MCLIAVLDDYQGVSFEHGDWSNLKSEHEVVAYRQPLGNEDQVADALQEMDVVCAMRERTPFPRSLLERLPNLKLLVTSGAKNAAIDMAAARELGITVCGTRSPGHAASELAFGLVLALARQITEEDRQMRSGGWQTTIGSDLRGQTLGILGLGRHGSNLARFGQAFGMRTIAWSQNLTRERSDELGVEYAEKVRFFRESDFITIHLKVGQRNRGLVGSEEFSLMKPGAYIVNTSRGPIIQEAALLDALESGVIAGAGIDVYDSEPLPLDHPLRKAPRTILTSHVGYVTRQTYDVFYSETVECIEGFFADKPVRVLNGE
ncbi:MAG: D-2-hydroxyacid dehydrogenase family protein [Candidatus Sedimenticola sp. 4PFRAG1]